MIVKKLGRICSLCGERFERNGKYQKNCDSCNEQKIRKFATIRLGVKIHVRQ